MKPQKKMNFIKKLYLALIIFFLYLPIIVLIISSFNKSKILGNWTGFTLKWYESLFANAAIMNALKTTLVLAFLAAFIATVLGTLACLTIIKMKKLPRSIITSITNIPMLNAEIVTGLAFMLLFIGIGISLNFYTVLIAHVTFCIPYVVLSVMPKVKQLDNSIYEAALDLGASPVTAFFKVTLFELLPGILSGFLMAFTMSLDDFIITHYTRGSGIDTLSTKIYTEVRKGIKPEMFALSTILFVTVFVLMFLFNRKPSETKKVLSARTIKIKRVATMSMCIILIIGGFASSFFMKYNSGNYIGELNVYNWGEYIAPEVIELFENKTGYKVNYEEFQTNEEMYTIVESGARTYDVVCPSDYMIEKMIKNNLLTEIDFNNITNISNIGEQYFETSNEFDPGNKYSIPYCWGTVGIIYNKTMVNEVVDSWEILFNSKYSNQILMQASVRDAYCVALSYLGYSINTLNTTELQEATKLLISQKPLVQAYVIDQVRDKMIKNSAAIGVIYSGEAIYMQRENPDLVYVVPNEGSNVWIDSWVIPKNCKNKEAAEAWIDFMCDPEIALMNFDYITYSTPNVAAQDLIEDEDIRNSIIAFPDDDIIDRCHVYNYLGQKGDDLYDKFWTQVGAAESK